MSRHMIYLEKIKKQTAGHKFILVIHKKFLQTGKIKKDKTYSIKMGKIYEYTTYEEQIQMTYTYLPGNSLFTKEIEINTMI